MPELVVGLAIVAVIAAAAVAIGVGFGRVVAPWIGRLLDRIDRDDEDAADGPD